MLLVVRFKDILVCQVSKHDDYLLQLFRHLCFRRTAKTGTQEFVGIDCQTRGSTSIFIEKIFKRLLESLLSLLFIAKLKFASTR